MKPKCKLMQKLKTSNKRGFTLVELVVILVILAILAALLIPQLIGYVEKAKETELIVECRSCVMAAKSLSGERYAKEITPTVTILDKAEIFELADVDEDGILLSLETEPDSAAITELTYRKAGSDKTCVYRDGTFQILPLSKLSSQAVAKAAELLFSSGKYNGGSSNDRKQAVLDLYKLMGMTEFQKVDTSLVEKVFGTVPDGYDDKRWVAYPLGLANGNPMGGDVVYYANSAVTTTDAYTGQGDQTTYNMIYINGILYYNPKPTAFQKTMQNNVATGAELLAIIKAKGWVEYTG